jgi:hypothetical protein
MSNHTVIFLWSAQTAIKHDFLFHTQDMHRSVPGSFAIIALFFNHSFMKPIYLHKHHKDISESFSSHYIRGIVQKMFRTDFIERLLEQQTVVIVTAASL